MARYVNRVDFVMPEQPLLSSAVDHVCRQLTTNVSRGRWPGGFTLIEAELSAQLQVSRSTVREALRRLESQGLVVKGRSRTLVVRRLTRSDVIELYDLREVLEAHAAGLAARHFGALDAARKKGWNEQVRHWRDLRRDDRIEALSDANQLFHTTIHALCGNSHLPRLLEGTLMTLFVSQFKPWLREGSMLDAAREHVVIGQAIASCDEGAAAAAMRAHVRSSAAVILALDDDAFEHESWGKRAAA